MKTQLTTVHGPCSLCDEAVAAGHGTLVEITGDESEMLCCPACYAMFRDFRTALRLMPASRHPRRGANRRRRAAVAALPAQSLAPA